jgi:glycosyltransferase involved in cell wall biosynthesis
MYFPKVSAIITTYNGESYIKSAINSVIKQTYKNIEIIVVDDGSKDDTYEKIKPYIKKIKYIYQKNSGISCARNTGIKSAEGDFIAFLDHDDLWLPEKIEEQVKYFLDNPQEVFVHSSIKYINHKGELIIPDSYWCELKINNSVENIKEILMHYAMFPSTMMIKKRVFEEFGYFDPDFVNCQGYELCLRIAKKYRLGYLDEPLVLYRISDGSHSNDPIRFDYYRIKVVETFLSKHKNIYKDIKRRDIKKRLFNLYYSMGKTLEWKNEHKQAKIFYLKALKKQPLNINIIRKVFWLSLTKSQRAKINWYKKRIEKVAKKHPIH